MTRYANIKRNAEIIAAYLEYNAPKSIAARLKILYPELTVKIVYKVIRLHNAGNVPARPRQAWADMSEEQKMKANCRMKTAYYVKKDLLPKMPCEVCRRSQVEAHHSDYSDPLKVRWLCNLHHRMLHMELKGEIRGIYHTTEK